MRIPGNLDLDPGGNYQWRRNGEYHLFNPLTIAKLQQATREKDQKLYDEYAELINEQQTQLCTLRGLLQFKPGDPAGPASRKSSRGRRS